MQTAKQLSVSMVNKPGRLADMLAALAKEKVNFLALSVMDTHERSAVRFVPEEVESAIAVLNSASIPYEMNEVLLAEIPSQPGGFRRICERLAADHLNIDYAYCSFHSGKKSKGGVLAVIKVNDLAKAQRILSENGAATRRRPPMKRPPKVLSRL